MPEVYAPEAEVDSSLRRKPEAGSLFTTFSWGESLGRYFPQKFIFPNSDLFLWCGICGISAIGFFECIHPGAWWKAIKMISPHTISALILTVHGSNAGVRVRIRRSSSYTVHRSKWCSRFNKQPKPFLWRLHCEPLRKNDPTPTGCHM